MKKITRRLVSTVASAALAVSMVPAVAGSAFADEAATVTADVTIRVQAAGAYLNGFAAPETVSSNLAESYGYADSIDSTKAVSALDVLVKAHEDMFGEAFTAADKDAYLAVGSTGYVSTIFSIATTDNGFLVNQGYPNDGTESSYGGYNGTTVSTTKVASGDVVDFLTYQDTSYWSDELVYVDAPAIVKTGAEMSVSVKSTSYMAAYMYKDAAALKAAANIDNVEDAGLAWIDVATGSATAVAGVTVGKDGTATVTAPSAAGTYYLTATNDADGYFYAIMNPTKISVVTNGLYKVTDLACDTGMIRLDNEDSPAYLNVTESGMTLNVRVYGANKYDYVAKATAATRPAADATDQMIAPLPIAADAAYIANGAQKANILTDTDGIYGAAGNKYKAMYYEIPVTDAELAAGQIDFAIRYGQQYASKPGQWMGTTDHYLTFGTATAVNTGVSGWGTVNTKSKMVSYLSANIATWVGQVNAISANAGEEDTDAYNTAVLTFNSDICYAGTTASATYAPYVASAVYVRTAFPETISAMNERGNAIPNVVPEDGTYYFLMNRYSSNGYACNDGNQRWHSAKLVVANGEMTLTISQLRTSYSAIYLGTAYDASLAAAAAGKSKVDKDVPGGYDFTVRETYYIQHPGSTNGDADGKNIGTPGAIEKMTATFKIDSLNKVVNAAAQGSAAYDASFILYTDNLVTEDVANLCYEYDKLMNYPDPDDKASTTPPPYGVNPTTITAESAAAIQAVQAKYDALSESDKALFDGTLVYSTLPECGTYGDSLRAASGAAAANSALDDSTTVAAGTYSNGITATFSNLEGATSPMWTVSQVKVADGKATATISLNDVTSVIVGGQTYDVANDKVTIPVALNGATDFIAMDANGPMVMELELNLAANTKSDEQAAADKAAAEKAAAEKAAAEKAAAEKAAAEKAAAEKAAAEKAAAEKALKATVTKGGVTYGFAADGKSAIVKKIAKSKKSVTIAATVKLNGKTYKVTGIAAKVFKGTKVKTVTIKSKTLTKKGVKNCLKGSKVKTVKVVKAKKKAYKKIFTKKNAGAKVTVK